MYQVKLSESVKKWLDKLEPQMQDRVYDRIDRLVVGHYGDCRSLGGGLFELKFRSGHRIYYIEERGSIILLLSGGNKDSQRRDIISARKLIEKYKGEK